MTPADVAREFPGLARAWVRFPINCIRLRSVSRALWVLQYELAE